eukprot:1591690-Prymnesium_polylepis.1
MAAACRWAAGVLAAASSSLAGAFRCSGRSSRISTAPTFSRTTRAALAHPAHALWSPRVHRWRSLASRLPRRQRQRHG